MIRIQKSEDRGKTKTEWLDSKHSFSFGRYRDPENESFGDLIVFNDDIVAPKKGFGAHPHENAEIISIVLSGALAHKDSKGNKGTIKEGEVQRISAGSGIWHSEINASDTEEVHFLQIWLEPEEIGIEPSYQQKSLGELPKEKWNIIVSKENKDNSLSINQDARFLFGTFTSQTALKISKDKGIFLFVIDGNISLSNNSLSKGDVAKITDEESIDITPKGEAKLLAIEVNIN